jgi:hypothetical protein
VADANLQRTYSEATALRERLEELGTERGDHIEAGKALEVRIGEALREVRDMPRVTMQDAADLLGMSIRRLELNLRQPALFDVGCLRSSSHRSAVARQRDGRVSCHTPRPAYKT